MMGQPLEGITRYIVVTTASAGAGNTDTDLRPTDGCVWEVLWCVGLQDDGAVAHYFLWSDPDAADQELCGQTAGVAYDPLYLGMLRASSIFPPWMGAPVLSYDRFLTYRFVASAGGKNGIVRALVKEYRGIVPEA